MEHEGGVGTVGPGAGGEAFGFLWTPGTPDMACLVQQPGKMSVCLCASPVSNKPSGEPQVRLSERYLLHAKLQSVRYSSRCSPQISAREGQVVFRRVPAAACI